MKKAPYLLPYSAVTDQSLYWLLRPIHPKIWVTKLDKFEPAHNKMYNKTEKKKYSVSDFITNLP